MWSRFEAVDPRTECRCASQGSSARRRRRQPSAAGRWVLHVSECACVPRVVRGIAVSASRIERTNTRPHTSLRSRRAERTVSRPVRFAPFYRVVRVWTRLPRLHELPGVSATTEQVADAFGTDALFENALLIGGICERVGSPHRHVDTVLLGRLTRQPQQRFNGLLGQRCFPWRSTRGLAGSQRVQAVRIERAQKPAHALGMPASTPRDVRDTGAVGRCPQHPTTPRPRRVSRRETALDFESFRRAQRSNVKCHDHTLHTTRKPYNTHSGVTH